MTTLKGTEVSLSYVHCFLYLVSSSVSASIFLYYMAGYLLDRPPILYRLENYFTIKQKEIFPFVTICMDLEYIMPSEISQTEEDK